MAPQVFQPSLPSQGKWGLFKFLPCSSQLSIDAGMYRTALAQCTPALLLLPGLGEKATQNSYRQTFKRPPDNTQICTL